VAQPSQLGPADVSSNAPPTSVYVFECVSMYICINVFGAVHVCMYVCVSVCGAGTRTETDTHHCGSLHSSHRIGIKVVLNMHT